ncbi:hypothetical protein Rin_00009240 [Candidatus Regiella insecticola 5.15]|uniref:Uncharacterized protein n=1 Tax=Candidatus Regiella insecticola 5.15 TaxID=1005043 RepID=G2GYR4_9ENTR|nr:hypothetical protein [Candidatus Regiella insecticola]EGY29119.1 hypothetical protein Rin_00009240 [Candidatus Regiella insecticola 5.15]
MLVFHIPPHVLVASSVGVVAAGVVLDSWVRGLSRAGNTNDKVVDTTGRAKSDAIAALVRAANAIEEIEVLATYPDAVADFNRVTKYIKDDIEGDADVSLDSLHGDLLNAAFVLKRYKRKIFTPALSRIHSDIEKAIDAIAKIKQYSFA